MSLGPINLSNPINRASPLAQGLVGAWFGLPNNSGGSRLWDVSGNHRHGTLTNMNAVTDWVPSPYGFSGLNYDGTDGHVPLAGLPSLGGVDFTCAVLHRPTNTTRRTMFGFGSAAGNGLAAAFQIHAAGPRWDVWGGATQSSLSTVVGRVYWDAIEVSGTSVTFRQWSDEGGYATSSHTNPRALDGSISSSARLGRYIEDGSSGYWYYSGDIFDSFLWTGRLLGVNSFLALVREARNQYPRLLNRVRRPRRAFVAAASGGIVSNVFESNIFKSPVFGKY